MLPNCLELIRLWHGIATNWSMFLLGSSGSHQSVFLLRGQGCKVLLWGIFCAPIQTLVISLFIYLPYLEVPTQWDISPPPKRQISSYKGNIYTFQDCADVDMGWYLGQGQKRIYGLQTCWCKIKKWLILISCQFPTVVIDACQYTNIPCSVRNTILAYAKTPRFHQRKWQLARDCGSHSAVNQALENCQRD